jgi:hypothetical protein
MSAAATPVTQRIELAQDLAQFTHDPLGFVYYNYEWGSGDLENEPGPRKWQAEVLEFIRRWFSNSLEGEDLARFGAHTSDSPCLIAISSGHDIGKSTLISWLSDWALSTFEDTRGTITANTKTQLDTKTQPELAKWFRLGLNRDWFVVHVTSIKVADEGHENTWRLDLVPWSEDNPAAAAGLHNKNKRLLIIFDEASEIPKVIFDTAEGVLLDEHTEIIWLIAGNPTINVGSFVDAVFGVNRHRWKTYVIDSRNVEGTNKKKLKEWEDDRGEDSDFFRVRARGLPPRTNSGQFIDQDTIEEAQNRKPLSLPDDPLVAGCDFAWGGPDDNVVRFRKGYDATCVKPIKVRGAVSRDPAVMTHKLAEILSKTYTINDQEEKVAALFLDSAGIAAPVEARLRQMGHKNIIIVNYGADSPGEECAYMRDYIWNEMAKWLKHGAIGKDIQLAEDLSKPLLVSDKKQRIKLESKEDMIARLKKLGITSGSPDDGDALACTFAMPVAPRKPAPPPKPAYDPHTAQNAWMG